MNSFLTKLTAFIKTRMFKDLNIDTDITYSTRSYSTVVVTIYKNVKQEAVYKKEYTFDNSVKEITEDERVTEVSKMIERDFIAAALTKFVELHEIKYE